MPGLLETQEMEDLLTLVEAAARSTTDSVKHFIEPASGTLRRTTNKRHHIVFGRRGSGKSSLLQKAAADLTIERRPIANVNLETFKGHSYPDVLLSVLISTFREFEKWLETAAVFPTTKTSFWKKLFGAAPHHPPFDRNKSAQLAKKFRTHIDTLEAELHRADNSELKVTDGSENNHDETLSAKVGAKTPTASAEVQAESKKSKATKREIEQKFNHSKTDFLHRHLLDYQRIFEELAELSGGDAFLFLDDLYHIRRADQTQVLDYFHRLAKGHKLWLKVGTIRHRSKWYLPGDPPMGMKIADDADEIDLDLTLEKYSLAKNFLTKILSNYSSTAKAGAFGNYLTDGALDRMVLASGGVARDFLSIFRRSVSVARERGESYRGNKVNVEDVNVASGESFSTKREDFERDTLDDRSPLEDVFQEIRKFCIEKNNTNCFLLDKDQHHVKIDFIHELVDLKLVHSVRSRVTISGRTAKIYEAYMLDLSQYTGARKTRNFKMVEFWKSGSNEFLRKATLIFSPDEEGQ